MSSRHTCLACAVVPALGLQLLVKRHPEWRGRPVALVAEQRPQARVLAVNELARRSHVLPGMRYAAALSLVSELGAGVVGADELAQATDLLVERLRTFSPDVEPSRDLPGVFWLDGDGLSRLFPERRAWVQRIQAGLKEDGFESNVVAACTRFGAYALARAGSRTTVFETPAAEAALVRRVPLVRLDLEPEARDELRRLGLQTVGDWLRLPANGVRLRFGQALYDWQRQAEGTAWTPLQPRPVQPVLARTADLEHPERDAERLLFLVKRLLDELLDELRTRTLDLVALTLHLGLDDRSTQAERLCPAAPTRDGTQLLGLVRLRLEAWRDNGVLRGEGKGIVQVTLQVEALAARQGQLGLFERFAQRDRAAAERALARLRAEFGAQAVVRARLREAHLPSACFEWEPLAALATPSPSPRAATPSARPAVRRLYVPALPLPPRPRREPDGWLLRGLEHGRVRRFVGPHLVSGGWWRGQGVQREYSFAELEGGEVLWVYYDVRRRRFFLEGRVE